MGNGAIKIEKGVQIPSRDRRGKYRETFEAMNPGDSFEAKRPEDRNAVLSAFSYWRKKAQSPFKLVSRRQSNGSYRFWLVQP